MIKYFFIDLAKVKATVKAKQKVINAYGGSLKNAKAFKIFEKLQA